MELPHTQCLHTVVTIWTTQLLGDGLATTTTVASSKNILSL
jgi:hypothetical protein